MVDVNFLVVHVHRTSTKHSVTIVRVTNGQTALGTRDNGNACLHADIVLVARAEGCRWQLLPSAGAMRTIDFVARRDALTYPPRVYAAIDTFTCNDLRPSVRRFLSKSNERHSGPDRSTIIVKSGEKNRYILFFFSQSKTFAVHPSNETSFVYTIPITFKSTYPVLDFKFSQLHEYGKE